MIIIKEYKNPFEIPHITDFKSVSEVSDLSRAVEGAVHSSNKTNSLNPLASDFVPVISTMRGFVTYGKNHKRQEMTLDQVAGEIFAVIRHKTRDHLKNRINLDGFSLTLPPVTSAEVNRHHFDVAVWKTTTLQGSISYSWHINRKNKLLTHLKEVKIFS